MTSSRGSSQPRFLTSPAFAGGSFTASATWEAPETWLIHIYILLSDMYMKIKMLFCVLVAVGGGEIYDALGKYFKLTLKEIWNSGVKNCCDH